MTARAWTPIAFVLLSIPSFGAVNAAALAQAYPNNVTARAMYDTCRRGVVVSGEDITEACIYYFEGVMGGVLLGAGMLSRDRGLLSGTEIPAIYQNAAELAYGCSPAAITLGQRIRVFMRWVQDNPAHEQTLAPLAFAMSNAEAWPCD